MSILPDKYVIDTCYASGEHTNGEVVVYILVDTTTNVPVACHMNFSFIRELRDEYERLFA